MSDETSRPSDVPATPEVAPGGSAHASGGPSPSAADPAREPAPGPGAAASSDAPPRHLWIVGGLAVLWNAVGAFDYVMTQTQNQAYMGQFTPEQLEYFYGFPAWVVFFWALAVWGAVLGSILLLLRKALAAPVFGVSLASMVVTSVHNFLLTNGLEVMGAGGAAFTVVIFMVAVGLWLYARTMADRGVLA